MKVEINEIDARNEVTKLLNDFDVDYCSDDISQLREKYPGYVAMYTKFIFNPEIAIRGINPSWFIGKEPLSTQDKEEEVLRVNSLRGLHDLNAYIDYPEAKYHGGVKRTFKNIFDIAELKYTDDEIGMWIKENVVGWNNCFIQTGSEGIDNLYKDAAAIDRLNYNSSCIDLIKKSVSVAKKLERLMQPNMGLNLRNYMFEQFTDETLLSVQNDIVDTFKVWLPFVEIRDIQVSMDENDSIGKNKMGINIVFNITRDPNTLESVQVEIGG